MAKITVKIADATVRQLREAAETLGCDVRNTMNAARLRSLIGDVYAGDTIEVEEDAAPTSPRIPAPAAMASEAPTAAPAGSRRARVLIHEEEHGINPVPIAVNGEAITILRGHEVAIEERFYHALDLSKRAVPGRTPDGGLSGEFRMVHTFPFQFLGWA